MLSRRTALLSGPLCVLFGIGALIADATAQRGQRFDETERQKPPVVHWQRTVADAIAVARARQLPLLICVNVDQEPASEVFAWRHYRDPEFGALTRGFVAVIVSPDRHTPQDHDELGRRIPCPRFGGVTCGEHIDADGPAYDMFFEENRVAPRHIGIGTDGSRLFDHYLERNTENVADSLRKHGGEPPASADSPLETRQASRAAADRDAVEAAFLATVLPPERHALLTQAAEVGQEPYGLILLGLRDSDPVVQRAASLTLAATATATALPLIIETIDSEVGRNERDELLGALERIAEDNPRARRAWTVRSALTDGSELIDPDAWNRALADDGGDWPADAATDDELETLDAELDRLATVAGKRGADGVASLALARATLRYALNRLQNGQDPSFLLEDAKIAAANAVERGADAAQAAAVTARVAYLQSDLAAAGAAARVAVPGLQAEAASPFAAEVLAILAAAGAAQIYAIADPEQDYPAAPIADADAAARVLLRHPHGEQRHAIAHLALLGYLGATRHASAFAAAALQRFPGANDLHLYLRDLVIARRGVRALEAAYLELAPKIRDAATWVWFTGYATLVAAEELQRKSELDGALDGALAAYQRADDYFERSAAARPEFADSARHFQALALAGRARIHLDEGRLDRAVELILAAIDARPGSAQSEDGLKRSPAMTARRLRDSLEQANRSELLAKLDEGLTRANLK